MKIPTPAEIGLPEKFDKLRPVQEETISLMLSSQKRAVATCVPTGGGKSVCGVAVALMSKQPTCITTNSRGLQSQYTGEFSEIGMVDIRGKSNYACEMKPDYTCEEGHASRCPYKGSVACPFSAASMRAATSSLVVTNYAMWINSRKYGQGMAHFKQVILDESHDAPGALAQALQVVLHHKEIEQTLGIDFLKGTAAEFFGNWKPWASLARKQAELLMAAAYAKISGYSDPKPSVVKHYTHMRNLSRRLATLSTARPTDWVVEEVDEGFKFDPIRPGKYAEANLLLRVPKIICMSATLRPKTMFMMGLGKDKFDFKEYDSEFDPKRCPIYYVPTMRVDARNTDLSLLWARIDQIIAKRQDRKGIIHTVSYARQEDILSRSRFASKMIINTKGEPPSSVIEKFKAAGPGTILVSPSVGTGYDFPGTACEWQILCKIPFEPPSKVLKAREQDDPEYRAYQAMQSMVQAFGRGMRHKLDRCENFILDDHCSWFIPRYGHLAPRSFHGTFKHITVLPQPPERLTA